MSELIFGGSISLLCLWAISRGTKLEKLRKDGKAKLQFVFDFDQTVTQYWVSPGVRNKTCHGTFSRALPGEFATEEKRLLDIYYPIEVDSSLDLEYRKEKMLEWWGSVHDLAVQHKMQREKLKQAVKDSGIVLRPCAREILLLLHEHKIPVLMMSAGVADVVEFALENAGLLTPNVTIISNKCVWNSDGVLTGFEHDVITSFNKNGTGPVTSAYWKQHNARPNVVLVGDSEGDANMTLGVPYIQTEYRVGFLNKNIQQRRDLFSELFDKVYEDDCDMGCLLKTIQTLLKD